MKIVVDTNIVFSFLLNTQNTLGEIFFNSKTQFEFYSTSYMKIEIDKHWEKLKKISNLSEKNLEIAYLGLLSKIRFINEGLIPLETWVEAENLTSAIDPLDIDFVALTIHLEAHLWTGDKILYNGLNKIDFKNVVNTSELLAIKNRN